MSDICDSLQHQRTRYSWAQIRTLPISNSGYLYTRFINRRLALPVTYMACRYNVSPNTLTGVGQALHLGGCLLLLVVRPLLLIYALFAYVLFVVAYVLDSSDGQVARVTNTSTMFGEWFDHVGDFVKLMSTNLVYGWWLVVETNTSNDIAYAIFAVAILGQSTHYISPQFRDLILRPASTQRNLEHPAIKLMKYLGTVTEWGVFIMLVVLLPFDDVFPWAYGVYGLISVAMTVGHFIITIRTVY